MKKNIITSWTNFIKKDINENYIKEMMSTIPTDLNDKSQKDIDCQILRTGIIAELDAINLYEQMAGITNNKKLKDTLLNIAKEEKTHIGEFETLLLELDKEQKRELVAGKKEVDEK